MKQIQLTQGKFALVDDEDFERINKYKWGAQKIRHVWYATGSQKGKSTVMHRFILNVPEGMQVDHINGDGLDNQKNNLRICTPQQNGANRRISRNNTTGYKGVYFSKKDGRYRAHIRVYSKTIDLGRFDNPELAAHAYDEAAISYWGEFARTNFQEGHQ